MSPHQILQFVLLSQTTVLAGMCQCVVSIYLHLSIFPAPQLWTLGSGWRMEIRDGERLWNLFYWERGLPGPESTRWIGPRKCSTLMFKENFRMAEITKWLVFLSKINLLTCDGVRWWTGQDSLIRDGVSGLRSWHLTPTLYQSINILCRQPQIFLSDWLIFPETPNVYITWDSNISKILR